MKNYEFRIGEAIYGAFAFGFLGIAIPIIFDMNQQNKILFGICSLIFGILMFGLHKTTKEEEKNGKHRANTKT